MILKKLFEDIVKVAVTAEDFLPVENIMLHIRMRGLKNIPRNSRRKIVFLAFPMVWVMHLILFPINVLTYIKSFSISLAAGYIPYNVGLITQSEFFMLSLFLWAVINYKSVCFMASIFLFDLLDFLSFGSLTEFSVYVYSILPKIKHMKLLNNKNYLFVIHFMNSRQILSDDIYEPSWESYFTSLATNSIGDEALLEFEVEKYWENIDEPNNLYITRYAPRLAVPTAQMRGSID